MFGAQPQPLRCVLEVFSRLSKPSCLSQQHNISGERDLSGVANKNLDVFAGLVVGMLSGGCYKRF